MKLRYVLSAILLVLTTTLAAQESKVATTEILLQTSTSWDGNTLPEYGTGQPEITVSRIVIPSGFELPVHRHPVPLAGYMVSGELTVSKSDSVFQVFRAGEVINEVINTWHYGKNTGDTDVVLIAFYAGIEGVPLSITKEN